MEKEILTDLTAIVTLSRGCEALLLAVDEHFRNVSFLSIFTFFCFFVFLFFIFYFYFFRSEKKK